MGLTLFIMAEIEAKSVNPPYKTLTTHLRMLIIKLSIPPVAYQYNFLFDLIPCNDSGEI